MKSAAIDLVSPITAALVVPYTKRFGTPRTLETTDETLMIEPPPAATMPGSSARVRRYIDPTLSCQACVHCASVQSRIVPACTMPAQLKSTLNGCEVTE